MSPRVAVDASIIGVDGVFDVAAAQRLATALGGVDGEIQVDLTRVREFHDCGVALLASAIARRPARTTVLGLHDHHLRLLRYLGIDTRGGDLSAGVELV